jgi:predicted dehydrogenase
MAENKAGLAYIGLGNWGNRLAAAAERGGGSRCVRCFARTEETRRAFAETFGALPAAGLDEIWRDESVEGVVISTPHSTHAEMIRQAASAGKHIFVEKPLTLTVSEGKRAIAAAEGAGVVLQIGHHRRRLGATRRIREMIDAGELGTLIQLEAHVFNANRQKPASGWQNDPEEWPVGGMTGRGVHMVDNFHYLAGPVSRVTAFSKQLLGTTRLDDITAIGLEFERGPLGYIGVSQVLPLSIRTAVFGTEAAAWSDADGKKTLFSEKGGASPNQNSGGGRRRAGGSNGRVRPLHPRGSLARNRPLRGARSRGGPSGRHRERAARGGGRGRGVPGLNPARPPQP